MYSIAFPNFFSGANCKLVSDTKATISNLDLLLKSWRTSLFGDPYFGTQLKKFLYEQNSGIIVDLVIDELYTAISTFMPQLYIDRKKIKIRQDKANLYADLEVINLIDGQSDLYTIDLITNID